MKQATLLMFLATSSLAFSNFYGKLAMHAISISLAVTSRFVVPLILMTIWFSLTGRVRQLERAGLWASVPRALALCAAQFCLYYNLRHTSLAESVILYNTGPVFICLYSFLRTRRITWIRIAALTLGFGGVVAMTGLQDVGFNIYVVTGVLSGFFQSVSQILLHKATKSMGTSMVMWYVYLIGSIAWGSYVLLSGEPLTIASEGKWTYLWLLFAALGSLGNQQFRGEAYRRVEDPAVLSPLIYVTVLLSAILDWAVYHRLPSLSTVVGGTLVMSGALLSLWDKDEPR